VSDSANKRHEASFHRLQKLKCEGRWYRSRDLTTAVVLGTMALVVGYGLPFLCNRATELATAIWASDRIASEAPLHVFDETARQTASSAALMIGGIMAAVFVTAALTQFLQVGPIFSTKPLWEVRRLNPVTGFKGIFLNGATYQKLAMNLVKAAVLLGIAAISVRSALNGVLFSMRVGPLATAKLFHGLFSRFLWQAAAVSLLFGGADYLMEKRRFLNEARMDDEELKEDQKETEGNVEAKWKARLRVLIENRAAISQERPANR
jgi:flagellar biosynthesis protein FlhB